MIMEQPECTTCGGHDIKVDAYGAWDIEKQDWYLCATFDKGSVCEDCGEERSYEMVEVPA